MKEETVWVRRQYDDHRKAKYYLEDVSDIHWDKISGGVGTTAPNWSLYGYVNCQGMIEGEVAHSGIHGTCPHRIKVCILKKDNIDIIDNLIEKVGKQPSKFPSLRHHICITDIKDILGKAKVPVKRDILLDELEKRGHSETAMVDAIKKHSDEIIKTRCSDDKRQFQYQLKN